MAGSSDHVHHSDDAVLVGRKMSQVNVELVAAATAEVIRASEKDKEKECQTDSAAPSLTHS